MSAGNVHDIKASVKIYLFVFGALAILTIVTVAASWLHLSVAAGIALALLIASLKGTLVASFFMHLTGERWALFGILLLCALFFFALILLPVLQTSETSALINQPGILTP